MVKIRQPASAKREPTKEEIEAFASGADGEGRATKIKEAEKPSLDPNAKRDYKAISVPFNEYEFTQLGKLARMTGRTKLNSIRWAIMKAVDEELKKI